LEATERIFYSIFRRRASANLDFLRVLAVGLANGGTAGLFLNYVLAAVGLGLAYASLAELGSSSVGMNIYARAIANLSSLDCPLPVASTTGSPS